MQKQGEGVMVMGDVGQSGVHRMEELYRDYHRPLFHFFVKKGLDEGTAEDLVQEVFLRLLRNGKDVDGDLYARNLVYRVAQNLLIDHFRKNNGTVRVRLWQDEDNADTFPVWLAESDLDPEECCMINEASKHVRSAFSRLPAHYAKALFMKEYQGMSYREIASDLGLTEKAVESLLHRAKSQLRKELVGAAGEGGWWSAVTLVLSSWRKKCRSFARRFFLTPGKGEAGHLTGTLGTAKVICNAAVMCLVIGAVVGSGFLGGLFIKGRPGHIKSPSPWETTTRNVEALDNTHGTIVESIAIGVQGNGKIEKFKVHTIESHDIAKLSWEETVVRGAEAMRLLLIGTGNILSALLGPVDVLGESIIYTSFTVLSSLGLPRGTPLYSLADRVSSQGTQGVTRQAVKAGVDVTYDLEKAALDTERESEKWSENILQGNDLSRNINPGRLSGETGSKTILSPLGETLLKDEGPLTFLNESLNGCGALPGDISETLSELAAR